MEKNFERLDSFIEKIISIQYCGVIKSIETLNHLKLVAWDMVADFPLDTEEEFEKARVFLYNAIRNNPQEFVEYCNRFEGKVKVYQSIAKNLFN